MSSMNSGVVLVVLVLLSNMEEEVEAQPTVEEALPLRVTVQTA
jgi:hypothetical protein